MAEILGMDLILALLEMDMLIMELVDLKWVIWDLDMLILQLVI